MNYEIRPEAEGDYLEALVYYGTRQPESALEFEAEFESLIERILESPRMYRVTHEPSVRQASMRRFPCSIVYQEVADGILIIAVAHHRRRQGYWLDRI